MKLAGSHLVAFVVMAFGLSFAQQPSSGSSAALAYEDGRIENNVYTNECFGFSLSIPDGWQLGTRLVGTTAKARRIRGRELYLLRLLQHIEGYSGNEIVLTAYDANGFAPTAQEFVSDALHKQIGDNPERREFVKETYSVDYGGKIFARADYKQKASVPTPYRAFVYTKFRGFYIGETLSAESQGELELAADSLQRISFREDEPNSKCVMAGDDNTNSEGIIGGVIGSKPLQSNSGQPMRVRVSQGVSTGLLVTKVQPLYPDDARLARIQGSVVLKAEIDKSGDVEELTLVSGHPLLAPAALEAVKQWKYKPYLLNGQPVAVETQVTVAFQLSGH